LKNSSSIIKFFVVAVLLAIPAVLGASFGSAAGGHDASGGVPTVVIFQFINFAIYIGIIVYLGRQPIANYFKNRQAGFYSALKKADAARAEAQAKRADVQSRLSKLEATRDESLQTARKEAALLRAQIVEEAKALSEKLRIDAERTAIVEIERAKFALREDLLSQSVQMAERILTDKMQEPDQKRLQDEFVQKIQSGKGPKNESVAT